MEYAALSSQDLEVTLNSATAFFPELVAFYPLHPVHRGCVEQYGARRFTKAEHIVSNGPFRLIERRIRDRIRLTKNEQYWNAAEVELESIDVMSIQSETTSLNMYLTGQLDWDTTPPNTMIPILKKRDDFVSTPFLASYFYRVNTEKPPLNNPLVRRALNLAIDKRSIVDNVVKGGQSPASSFVPPGMNGYEGYRGSGHNVKLARQLLAEAGYSKGLDLTMEMIATSSDYINTSQFVATSLKEVGVNLEVRQISIPEILKTHLPTSVLDFKNKSEAGVSVLDELTPYLMGAFGSAQRLDYGTGHELSFLAFLGCIWKLGGFPTTTSQDGDVERSIVLGVVEPCVKILRTFEYF